MAKQLGHLEELQKRPNVVVQVSPYSLAEHRPLSHPVALLTLPNRTQIGYTETLQRGFLEQDADTVSAWADRYTRLQVDALTRADSLAVIRAARKGLEGHAG